MSYTDVISYYIKIGVRAGQSIQMWNDYFRCAHIFGLDNYWNHRVTQNLEALPRVQLIDLDAYNQSKVDSIGYVPESMDIIIDDALHSSDPQQTMLANFWKYVKPGGYYIIEDVDAQRGGFQFEEHPELLRPSTTEIFENNHVCFIDSSVGHRNWNAFLESSTKTWMVDHRIHNSYLVVIRKRIGPVPPVHSNAGVVAMDDTKLVKAENTD
jgi:hypothetical protein